MLNLKNFKSFEVNSSFKVIGGKQGYTSHSSGHDMIYEENGVERMDVNGEDAGCRCGDGTTFSPACC